MNEVIIKELDQCVWKDIKNPSYDFLVELNKEHQFGTYFLEDILQRGHLPKFEKKDDWCFIIFRVAAKEVQQNITVDNISHKIAILYNDKNVITIHRDEYHFNEVDSYKSLKPDDLVLSLLNEMLLTYIHPIHTQSLLMDNLEEKLFIKKSSSISLENLYFERSRARISKKIILMFHAVLPHLEGGTSFEKYNDLKDTVQNHILMYDEILEDANMLLNSYLAIKAQKSNDIMTLLAIFSAFFLPLTFIAGLYGMNFVNMPELKTEYGYYATLTAMVLLSLVTYRWFKKRGIL